jgi:anti-sigma regulatory factor (Ser/Thr protein kinase)
MDVRDDVALLMIKVQPEHVTARRILPFVLPSKSASVSKLVDLAREAGQALLDQDPALVRRVVDDFALALDEAVSNQIQHAYQGAHGRLQGRISVYSDRLEADLFDYGVPFETSPRGEINLDDPPDRGYGLRLMDGLLDSWSYKRIDVIRNHWNLVKGLGLKEETQKESFAEQE